MKRNSELRAAGRADLAGRWNEAAMLTFVYIIISGVANALFGGVLNIAFAGVGNFVSILLIPMGWGFSMTFLALHRHEEGDTFDMWHLLDGYRDFRRIFCTLFLQSVYTVLWSLLLFIPGIVKACSYAMTPYILRDRKDLSNNAAIELSMAMMQGHKMDYFLLELSFLGWVILCILSLGIGFFWLSPYMQASVVNFYEDVKRDFENGGYIQDAEVVSEDSGDHYQK